MTIKEVKALKKGASVKIATQGGSYWAMVVWSTEDDITFVTENFAKSTCKFKNYKKTWNVIQE